jgi:hypothetical protein
MLANMMQAMPHGFDGPFSVSAPLADGGLMRRGPLGRRMPYIPTAPFGIPGQPQSTGGYDSSGINPHGMYSGNFGQPQFPHNPGGFQPMGILARLSAYR